MTGVRVPLTKQTVALFMMTGHGHFSRLCGLIEAFAGIGVDACVFTERAFERQVREAGGRFFDLYSGGRTVETIDSSRPRPLRNATFAAVHADAVAKEVASLEASVIVADSHAVIGLAVANELGLPYVCIRPGHDVHPEVFRELAGLDPRLDLDPRCLAAVEVLRERYGIADASPFLYYTTVSPLLNLYCAPEQFISEETRRAVEPVAFLGSLRSVVGGPRRRVAAGGPTQAYVSFGTVVWGSWAEKCLAAMEEIAAVIDDRPGMSATFSLGDWDVSDDAIAALSRPGVSVERFVDQRAVLARSDVFVTHHGLNSTHESIADLVPMISYPFEGDQFLLAARAQRLGLAVPLGEGLAPPPGHDAINAAFDAVEASREAMSASLERARTWELEAIAGRSRLARRIAALG